MTKESVTNYDPTSKLRAPARHISPTVSPFTQPHDVLVGNIRPNPNSNPSHEREVSRQAEKQSIFARVFPSIFETKPVPSPLFKDVDPFQDPIPKPKRQRLKGKSKKGKVKAIQESPDDALNPFRDPEPMRLIDEQDYRLKAT